MRNAESAVLCRAVLCLQNQRRYECLTQRMKAAALSGHAGAQVLPAQFMQYCLSFFSTMLHFPSHKGNFDRHMGEGGFFCFWGLQAQPASSLR